MKFITVSFDYDGKDNYERLADVFCYSALYHCPDAVVEHVEMGPPPKIKRKQGIQSNTSKLDVWVDRINASKDERIILIDCDMIITGNIFEAFDRFYFDIAYTNRDSHSLPLNGGVIFVRNNERSVAWINELKKINEKMYCDRIFHKEWRSKYAGINQAAMGYLIENYPKDKIRLISIPCIEWNCANPEWQYFDPNKTKAVHVKGRLRQACIMKGVVEEHYSACTEAWKSYERGFLENGFE